jgi:hypothetical protein
VRVNDGVFVMEDDSVTPAPLHIKSGCLRIPAGIKAPVARTLGAVVAVPYLFAPFGDPLHVQDVPSPPKAALSVTASTSSVSTTTYGAVMFDTVLGRERSVETRLDTRRATVLKSS